MKKWLVWLARIDFIILCWFYLGYVIMFLKAFLNGVFLMESFLALIAIGIICVAGAIPLFYMGWKLPNPSNIQK